jgi:hypothetical protein
LATSAAITLLPDQLDEPEPVKVAFGEYIDVALRP